MGRVIEKAINKRIDGKPVIDNFTMSFEYRNYMDDGKVINRFYHNFIGFLMKEKRDTISSKICYLLDPDERKVFCYQLHPDSKIDTLNTPLIIESILQNITFTYNLMSKIYNEDIDNIPVIPLTIVSPNALVDALKYWKISCAKRFNIDISQCHEVTLLETMTIEDMNKMNIPDYQIIRSQRESISLFKKI